MLVLASGLRSRGRWLLLLAAAAGKRTAWTAGEAAAVEAAGDPAGEAAVGTAADATGEAAGEARRSTGLSGELTFA
jgi:hypothetical protein